MSRYFIYALLLTALAFAGCGNGVHVAPEKDDPGSSEIVKILEQTAQGWNQGDLDAFLASYDSASTFMTSSGPIGPDTLRERFKAKYFAGTKPDQNLRFESMKVRELGSSHALIIGRYILTGGDKPDQSGWFTLVWAKTPHGWKILHDHSQ